MGRRGSGGSKGDPKEGGGGSGFRVPSVLMIPVGMGVGWVAGNWLGAVMGGVIGFFLWRSRA